MNPRHPTRHPLLLAALVVSLPSLLAGCGNKGPLVMAETPEPIEAPATPVGAVPVEIEPQQTLPAAPVVGALPDATATDSLIGTPATTDPMPASVDPAPADDAFDAPATAPANDDRIPIDPATVPDSPPASGTADDTDG